MDNIFYDLVRSNEMDSFLKKLYRISVEGNIKLTSSMIYNLMKDYGLKSSDFEQPGKPKDVMPYFENWQNVFQNAQSMHVFVDQKSSGFCQFVSNDSLKKSKKFIKLYIPIDYKHLYNGVIDLFSFIDKSEISHESKVSHNTRSDNVIIRLREDDYQSAKKIINYINSNQYIKEGLNVTNPFVPTINGIGFMIESGISYNWAIANLCQAYIDEIIRSHQAPSIETFYEWFKLNPNITDEIASNFYISIDSRNRNVKRDILSNNEKISLLINSLNATYEKYGFDQTFYALKKLIESNDYTGFTNGSDPLINYRNELSKAISGAEVSEFIRTTLEIKEYNYESLDQRINVYLQLLLSNKLKQDFEKICEVTLQNHDEQQLEYAINLFLSKSNPIAFSRFPKNGNRTVNYREKMSQFSKESIISIMTVSLAVRGINYRNSSQEVLTKLYINSLPNGLYNEGYSSKSI